MTKQKHGFLLFLASLIPGAGELYMGFRKQGLSIMAVFWGIIALASATFGFGWILMFTPILWFYSFFNVHNLKSLSEEEFYAVEDTYILHIGEFLGDAGNVISKYRKLAAIVIILIGFSMLWSILTDILFWLLPNSVAYGMNLVLERIPQLAVAVALVAAGIYIITDKKHKLDLEESSEKKEEHFWQPYRPYQQPADTESSSTVQNQTDAETPVCSSDQTPTSAETAITADESVKNSTLADATESTNA